MTIYIWYSKKILFKIYNLAFISQTLPHQPQSSKECVIQGEVAVFQNTWIIKLSPSLAT